MNFLFHQSQHVMKKMQTSFDMEGKNCVDTGRDALFARDKSCSSESLCSLQVQYFFASDIPLRLGQRLCLQRIGNSQCTLCDRVVNKLFGGFCYVCFRSKACADMCVLSPHLCHYHKGTCREPQWGQDFCFQPHVVYLAFTDKFKVGITRQSQMPTRWADQGATLAGILAWVDSRRQAGVLEKFLSSLVGTSSHWRNMLKKGNQRPPVEEFVNKMEELKAAMISSEGFEQGGLLVEHPLLKEPSIQLFSGPRVFALNYHIPPDFEIGATSLNLDKHAKIEGTLEAIKGQYLILDGKAFSVRRHEGVLVDVHLENPVF